MRYLNCLEMLNYILRTLKADTRQAVPVHKMDTVMTSLVTVQSMLVADQITDIVVRAKLSDILNAVVAVEKNTVGMTSLTDTMKQELVKGVKALETSLATEAYSYYWDNEFEDTPEIRPLMRQVVSLYAESGGRIC